MTRPIFIPPELWRTLLANGQCTARGSQIDPFPVIKLFTPDANATWLLSEIDPEDVDRAFGLCDLGLGCPELGYVSLSELRSVRGRLGLPIELDEGFSASSELSSYVASARIACRIIA
jgi:hypothetical protein